MLVASLPSHPLFSAAGESVSVSKVIVIYLPFLNIVELALLSSFCVVHNPTRWWLSNKSVMIVNSIKHILSLGFSERTSTRYHADQYFLLFYFILIFLNIQLEAHRMVVTASVSVPSRFTPYPLHKFVRTS